MADENQKEIPPTEETGTLDDVLARADEKYDQAALDFSYATIGLLSLGDDVDQDGLISDVLRDTVPDLLEKLNRTREAVLDAWDAVMDQDVASTKETTDPPA